MMRYRNKLVYDANTGEIRDDRKFMSMMEDFEAPRSEGGRGTEISTLPGGQNLENFLILNISKRNFIVLSEFPNPELLLMVDSTLDVLLKFCVMNLSLLSLLVV